MFFSKALERLLLCPSKLSSFQVDRFWAHERLWSQLAQKSNCAQESEETKVWSSLLHALWCFAAFMSFFLRWKIWLKRHCSFQSCNLTIVAFSFSFQLSFRSDAEKGWSTDVYLDWLAWDKNSSLPSNMRHGQTAVWSGPGAKNFIQWVAKRNDIVWCPTMSLYSDFPTYADEAQRAKRSSQPLSFSLY